MGESTIKLYAVNKTSSDLDMTFSINLIGFVSDESSPLNKILKPDVKQYLMTLTAPSGVNCEYKTSVSYKKIRKQGDITETKIKTANDQYSDEYKQNKCIYSGWLRKM